MLPAPTQKAGRTGRSTEVEFGVLPLPTMILFDRGEPVEAFAGKVPPPMLRPAVETHR